MKIWWGFTNNDAQLSSEAAWDFEDKPPRGGCRCCGCMRFSSPHCAGTTSASANATEDLGSICVQLHFASLFVAIDDSCHLTPSQVEDKHQIHVYSHTRFGWCQLIQWRGKWLKAMWKSREGLLGWSRGFPGFTNIEGCFKTWVGRAPGRKRRDGSESPVYLRKAVICFTEINWDYDREVSEDHFE